MFKSIVNGRTKTDHKSSPCHFEWIARLYTRKHSAQSDHFADAFVCEKVLCCCDIVTTFESKQADAILIREIQCKKKDSLTLLWVFQGNFCWIW